MAKSAQRAIQIKRAYEAPAPDDGERILVDRLWPRGLAKAKAAIALWLKEVAPSAELRTWYGHEPERFAEFRRRYQTELAEEPGRSALAELREHAAHGPVTLVFAARDSEHSNAAVLRELLAT